MQGHLLSILVFSKLLLLYFICSLNLSKEVTKSHIACIYHTETEYFDWGDSAAKIITFVYLKIYLQPTFNANELCTHHVWS